MIILRIVLKSAWHRRVSLLLTVLSIAISVSLLLGVDKIRKEAKNSFINTISQTDLIVGARSGPINLLLYSVFRIGNATNNISWESYEEIRALDEVAWAIPISLGDSHRGFRVMGTSADYFDFYRYGQDRPLTFAEGRAFADVYEAVLGADVARALGYELGDEIVIAHGLVAAEFAQHDDKPFVITGILARTATPVDRTVHVSLEGIEAIHADWQGGARSPLQLTAEQARLMDLQPQAITAFLVGLENRIDTFRVQRTINDYARGTALGDSARGGAGRTLADNFHLRTGSLDHRRLRTDRRPPGHAHDTPVNPQRATTRDGRTARRRRSPLSHRAPICAGDVYCCITRRAR